MIFLDSRYADGTLFKAWNARKSQYDLAVFRTWTNEVKSFFIYEWVETDRIDNVATRFYGEPNLWWVILDMNPEILNPQNIPPGTQLRISHA